jgi:DNA-binding HxlR family transcriptional regulator
MPTNRSYRDSCGVARALDVVGERWALLVVRELLLAPQRFSELRQALPNVSSNVLADRLRELEHNGVVKNSEPQGYELTERGRKLEPIVRALGDWGIDAPQPQEPASLSATSVLIYLQSIRPEGPPMTCRLELDGRVWTLEITDKRVEIEAGEPAAAEISLRTDAKTLSGLLQGSGTLEGAAFVGDVEKLLKAIRPR